MANELPVLLQLEQESWAAPMRHDAAKLSARLLTSPTRCFVLEISGAVLGVIQTQRIESVQSVLALTDWHAEDVLYARHGAVLQLFRVNTFLK